VLLAVSALAIAQPVLDVFGRSPETFVFAGTGPWTIVAWPVFVSGVVDLAPTDEVVVVVNGRVAGVSPVFVNFVDEARFAVMVPEMLLRQSNELAPFSIADGPGAEMLHPLGG
jgi:hypothetical protein